MKISKVKISNILSIEDATVEFDDSGLMLIQGWNYDVNRANGAGKTAILNAITFALYDKIPRKITATEILRRGSKSGFVELTVDCNGESFTVKRSRPKGVTFFIEGTEKTLTQEEWEAKLGLNYNQFIISMYCAQTSSGLPSTRFLSLNDSDKKQFLLQLLNLEEFSTCRQIAESKSKELIEQINALTNKENNILSKMDIYSESLIDENVYSHAINNANLTVSSLTAELLEAQNVQKPDLEKFKALEENIFSKRAEFAKIKTKREMLHDSYRKIASKIKPFNGKNSCDSCGSVLDTSSAKKHHEEEMTKLNEELAVLKSSIDECDEALLKEKSIQELSNKLSLKKKEETRDYEAASSKASDIKSKILLKQRELKELTLKLENNSELLSKIKLLADEAAKIATEKQQIVVKNEFYKAASAMFSPTGAQAYILDSVIDSFNEKVKDYTSILWGNMSYSLKSYKETVKGDITAKFSETLIMDGKEISIGSLSGGEFRALSLCVDFALIDVMEAQFGISMSPITLDEPFDGLDAEGREVIIGLLEKISEGRQVVVIDHTSEIKSMFSKVLTVEKRGGVSAIKLNA